MKKGLWVIGILLVMIVAVPVAYATTTNNSNSPSNYFQNMFQWMSGSNGMMDNNYNNANNIMGSMMGGSYGGMMNGYGGMMGGYYGSANQNINQNNNQRAQYNVNLKILPDSKPGADGKKHDAFYPADFTLKEGVPVKITISNYDDMPHSLTSSALGLNIQAKGSTQDGQPGVTTFTFTPHNAGDYQWICIDPCDLDANGWAMSQNGFMQGTIHVK